MVTGIALNYIQWFVPFSNKDNYWKSSRTAGKKANKRQNIGNVNNVGIPNVVTNAFRFGLVYCCLMALSAEMGYIVP